MKRTMNEERETMIRRLLSVFISLILMAGKWCQTGTQE